MERRQHTAFDVLILIFEDSPCLPIGNVVINSETEFFKRPFAGQVVSPSGWVGCEHNLGHIV